MCLKRIVPLILLFHTNVSISQLSIKNPHICHDQDNYLKCYYDGKYFLSFEKGNFKEYRNADSTVRFADAPKTLTVIRKLSIDPGNRKLDTLVIQLLSHSILLKQGSSNAEITSLAQLPDHTLEFDIGTYSNHRVINGFTFFAGGMQYKIDISAYLKAWSWDIIAKDVDESFAIIYNGFKRNRMQFIFIQDTTLKFGMAISTTFKSWKKIDELKSMYTEDVDDGETRLIRNVPLENSYRYVYDKKGRLKKDKTVGEIKFCECH